MRKEDYGKLDYYDLWLPDLAPTADLVKFAMEEPSTPKRWAAFEKRYRREMQEPAAQRLLGLLAAMSRQTHGHPVRVAGFLQRAY